MIVGTFSVFKSAADGCFPAKRLSGGRRPHFLPKTLWRKKNQSFFGCLK
jgi:hypothetical protein